MAEAIELTAGRAYRVRLQGSKRVDPIVVDGIEDGQVSYRLTWLSKGERVFEKPHTRPAGEVEVIAALDPDQFVWKQGDVEVQPKAEEPKAKHPRTRRPRKEPVMASLADLPGLHADEQMCLGVRRGGSSQPKSTRSKPAASCHPRQAGPPSWSAAGGRMTSTTSNYAGTHARGRASAQGRITRLAAMRPKPAA
jgi:hypothetical protein